MEKKNRLKISLEKRPDNEPKQRKEKREGATGPVRITREKIEKWNQMTAWRLQTRGDIGSSPPPIGPCLERFWRTLSRLNQKSGNYIV